ncbi:hypothetical protein CgunFtcFv8_021116 [Champsocephalus gunnari]|uniref:Uncharacterized protein n=1 Tax=Champsocephalus gunnari TaxID=52237 RepID=A0AAN8EBI1_CHAGU|nr:hypothetical protein CgunFtcFv8_021116 [Champsocephalus gunnari]
MPRPSTLPSPPSHPQPSTSTQPASRNPRPSTQPSPPSHPQPSTSIQPASTTRTIHSAIPTLTSINVCFHSARPFHSNGFCSPSSAIIF